MIRAVFPGSFDPLTLGHEDIIRRAAPLFDTLVVGVLNNSSKSPLLTVDERIRIIKNAVGDIENVEVRSFDGLLIDFVRCENASVIVRGIRNYADFEYELNWSQANHAVSPDIETVFLATAPEYSYISSGAVREYAKYNGDITGFVSPEAADMIKIKFSNCGGNGNEQN